jgi:hypothetical protein
MLRIVTLWAGDDGATLRLEGRIVGPWVDELRRACQEVRARGATLTLDAGDVAFVERRGARLLRDLMDQGVAVVNCPAFVCEQLKALSRC